ncbi:MULTISPECIES: GNAT family N-acetyltransferase [Pantoea]|nr:MULTISPECIES: GNAT family N-acetyltransferase [Pantoea]MBN1090755.1 GNAT family N-acetyltransferase [Pantoea sp. 1B4]MDY0901470.1 GNAT family N-acetyltransferase [Pantoea agglomerans]OXH78099.1 GNAT family N-acetyltransferase [Pantoea agglomerans]SMQ29757.1 Protein N-acetyltransferase, RimJ/RimL family [Pantoea agglomerans]
MVWESERLLYRYTLREDLDDLFRIYGDPETHKFNPRGPWPDRTYAIQAIERILQSYQEQGFGDWTIFEKAHPDKIIGFGGVFRSQFDGRQTNNLGYRFEPAAWGKGYATELSRRAIRYGFEEAGLSIITGVTRENHLASRRVLEKAGLTFLKKVDDPEGLPPSLMYTLTRRDWLAAGNIVTASV